MPILVLAALVGVLAGIATRRVPTEKKLDVLEQLDPPLVSRLIPMLRRRVEEERRKGSQLR